MLEVGDDPDGWAPPISVRRGKARRLAGPREKLAGWASRAVQEKGRGRKKGLLGLGRAGREKKARKLAGWAAMSHQV
jgi:hypothetical protein